MNIIVKYILMAIFRRITYLFYLICKEKFTEFEIEKKIEKKY